VHTFAIKKGCLLTNNNKYPRIDVFQFESVTSWNFQRVFNWLYHLTLLCYCRVWERVVKPEIVAIQGYMIDGDIFHHAEVIWF